MNFESGLLRICLEYIDLGPKIQFTLARVKFFDTNLTRRIEWDGPEVLISLQIPRIVYFGSGFPDDGGGIPTTLAI